MTPLDLKIEELYRQYNLKNNEVILIKNEMNKACKAHEWDKSIRYCVIKEILWDITSGTFSTYSGNRFHKLQNALNVVLEGKWQSPKHFTDLLTKQNEEYENEKKIQLNEKMDPKIKEAMLNILTKQVK